MGTRINDFSKNKYFVCILPDDIYVKYMFKASFTNMFFVDFVLPLVSTSWHLTSDIFHRNFRGLAAEEMTL